MSNWTINNDNTLEIFPTDTGKTMSVKYLPKFDMFKFKLMDNNSEPQETETTVDLLLSGRELQVLMEFLFTNCRKEGWWLEQDGNEWWEKQKEQEERNREIGERHFKQCLESIENMDKERRQALRDALDRGDSLPF